MNRRELLKQGALAVGSGAAVLVEGRSEAAAQNVAPTPVAGRRFRAFVRTNAGASVQEVRLLPLADNMVLIRTEATQCCYTIVNQALGTGPAGGAGGAVAARVLGHGGVGIVEAVGTAVKRVR